MNLHDPGEIAALSEWIDGGEAQDQSVLLSGVSGSGRRFLLNAAAAEAATAGLKVIHVRVDLDGWEPDAVSERDFAAFLASKNAAPQPAFDTAEEPPTLDRALLIAAAVGGAHADRVIEAGSLEALADSLADDERLVIHAVDSAALPSLARTKLFELGTRPGVRFALSCSPGDGTGKVSRDADVLRFEMMPLDAGEIRAALGVDKDRAQRLFELSAGMRGVLATRFDPQQPEPLLAKALEGFDGDERRRLESFAHLAALCGETVPVKRLLAFLGVEGDEQEDWIDRIDETLGSDSELKLFADRFQHPSFPGEQVYGFQSSADAAALCAALPADSRARLATELLTSFIRTLTLNTRAGALLFVELCRRAGGDRDRRELERELAWWVGAPDAGAMRDQLAAEVRLGVRTFPLLWETVNAAQFRWPAYRTLAVLEAAETSGIPQELAAAIEALRSGLLLQIGRFADAEVSAKKGVEIAQDKLLESALVERLGAALRSQGRQEAAAEQFARAHALRLQLLQDGDPRAPQVLQQYAAILRKSGEEEKAAEIEAKLGAVKPAEKPSPSALP